MEALGSLLMFVIAIVVLVALFRFPFSTGTSNPEPAGGRKVNPFSVGDVFGWMAGRLYRAVSSSRGERGYNARFMGWFERRKLLSPGHGGFVIDGGSLRLSEEDSCRNLAVIASTGAGKTSAFIIPNLLSINSASMVITDPSGALFEKTSGDLARRGYNVLMLNPLDLAASVRFNPLAHVRSHTEANEIAHILIKTAYQGASGDPFWRDGAEDILTILIRTLKNHPDPRYANLTNVQYLLNNFGDGTPLNGFIADHADEQIFQQFKGFISASPNTKQGLVSSAKTALKMLSDPDIARLTARNTLDFASLRKEKTALFLVFPQNRISYYSFLMNLLYTQLFHYCLDDRENLTENLPIYFLLDEFAHISIPDFPSIITTTRQRRVAIAIVLQSISQLEEKYGKQGAHTILNGGVASQLYFSGCDIDTATMLERTLGVRRHEIRDSEDRVLLKDDALLTAQGIRTMPDDQVLFLHGNKPPVTLRVKRYFEQSDMVRRTQIKPCRKQTGLADERVEYLPL